MSTQFNDFDLQLQNVSRPIAGAATAITAFVGCTRIGEPNKITDISSFSDFERIFGTADPSAPLSFSVRQYFINGGRQAQIIKVSDCLQSSVKPALQILLDHGEFNLLVIPETFDLDTSAARDVINMAIRICELRQSFYLIDLPALLPRTDILQWINWLTPSCNAALYYPAIRITDHMSESGMRFIASSGAVAGVYARTDMANGVWMPPAGNHAMLIGVQGQTLALNNADNDELNRYSVNTLRTFPGLGTVVWGARTLSYDVEWKYIHVRRTAMYLEASIREGLVWVMNEPNNESLWTDVSNTVSNFLFRIFKRGIFPGAKPDEAFFVKCGRDTITSIDQANGTLNIIVGFALLKPAEFTIVKISLATH